MGFISDLKLRLRLRHRYKLLRDSIRTLGPWAALKFNLYGTMNLMPTRQTISLRPKGIKHSLLMRTGHSSDNRVFEQNFFKPEYACLDDLKDVDLILDCGANVGYTAAYFLAKHLQSHVIAVEPDPKNFEMLQKNVAPYGDRVTALNTGLWSHETGLVMQEAPYRDSREWARQVREVRPGETPMFNAVGIDNLLAMSGRDRISILKIDIEGAEAVVFRENYEQWLPKVDNLVIELHDDSNFGPATDIFYKAIERENFKISHWSELVVCRR